MGLFKMNYDRPGPGVEKDAPPKKGIFRWWEVFTRDFSALLLTNLYLVVCALPTLTCTIFFYVSCTTGQPWLLMLALNVVSAVLLGPALAATHRLTLQMARDVPFFTWHEFKKAFKQDFKQGAISMAIMAVLGDIILMNLYLLTVMESYSMFTVIMLALCIYLWFSLLNSIFQQIALMELPLHTILKNSLLLILVSGWRGFLITILDIGFVLLLFMYSPIAAPLLVFGLFAFFIMTTDLIFWPRFNQLFITRDLKRKSKRSASAEWQEVAEETRAKMNDSKAAKPEVSQADAEWARTFLQQREELEDSADTQETPAAGETDSGLSPQMQDAPAREEDEK